ncbi:uncharacterized protein LOC134538481 isoform X2 [Bacillus rossius redtenbacheri]|uniref:uncharacterized protein LOC134538481 isoform X2 n=1 Tax=Bacillus rossius redtenbacheri TaxID=93214 RepID=UPI002FDDC5BC
MLVVRLYQNEIFVFSLYFINITMAEGVCVEEDPVKPEPFETVLLPVKEEIENCIMADQSDDPMDLTDLPLPLWSNVLTEAQDAAASTSATPFAEPPTIAAPKSKAQKQREYRQSLAVSRNAAQAIAARKLDAERQRKSRLRKAAILALASGSLESTTASSSRSGARSEDVQTGTRRLTHQQRLTSAAEPAQITVRPDTSPDQIEAQQAQSTWNAKWASSIMRFKSTFLDNDFGHACSVCDRLWFKNDLKPITAAQLEVISEWFIKENRRLCREEYEMVCNTCKRSLNKKSMPPLAKVNGFSYPDQPPGLPPLDPISERLITPRLPFMQVRRLRHDFSCGIIGQVINIPVDVQDMVNYLPRQLNEDDVINVNIKQNLAHKSVYISGYMSKSTISAWLTVLQKSALYCLYEINVDFSRLHPTVPFLDDIQDNPSNRIENISAENTPESEILASRQHTMMWNEEDGLYIAPGHRAKYLNIIYDRHAEELSFPSIYFGEPRRFNMGVSVSPYMIATSEIRRRDRRGATPQKILYVALKILRLRMVDGIYSTFRNVSVTENVTRRMLEDPEFLKEYVIQNLAFMKTMPNSVQYWASCKRDLFAIIRQLGKPTVFLTISANEIRWMKLLTILLKLSKKYPGKTAKDLNTSERCTLVSDDPVTCCIYFYRLVGSLMKMLKSKQSYNPFGKYFVKDYFLRIEFQHQGSPHAHILLWLNDDPRETVSENMPRTIDLVETISSVARDDVPSNSIYANQIHKHTFTCTKRGETTCRFGIPYWPMTTTRVLVPIPQSNGRRQMLQQKAKEMGISLGEHRYACMDEFLNANCLTYVSYLDIVRSTLRRPTLVFRRNFDELMTNTFNPYLAGEVNSNIDIQFILDDYSCAEYVVEYVNKSARGMSNLHRELTTMMQEHPDQDYTGQLKALSIKLLNGVEMSAQEAAWYLLRQPMSETSRDVVYIPTVWPTERQRCRKRRQQMDREGIDGDSTDVWTKNIIQRYEERPESLEQVYLAEFASWYANANDFVDEEDDVHVDDDKDSDGVPEARTSRAPKEYRRRLLGRVIRYRRYDIDETVDYKREMVLLYVQFRNEVSEIVDQNKFLQLFDDNKGLIMERRSLFETNLNIENVMKKLEAMMIFRNKDNSNLQEEESRAAFVQRLLGEDGAEKVDVVNQIVPRQGFSIVKKCSNVMTKQQYCELVRTTNPEQREIILETMAEGVCVEEDPVKPEPFETVLLPVKQEIETMAEGVCVEEDPVKPESFETVLLPVKEEIVSEDEADGGETAESRVKVKEEIDVEDFQASEQLQEAASLSEPPTITQWLINGSTSSDQIEVPDKPMDLTDLPLPLWSNVLTKAQDAAAFTSAMPFAKPPTISAPKSSAQRQREYRQRIAASRTPEQSTATRISEAERKRNYRLRKAYLALASGSLESTTAPSSLSAGRLNYVQTGTQQQLTNQQRQSLAAEPAQTTVIPGTSSDRIEVPDKPIDLTDLPLPSRSNAPVETQDAAATTSATPFAEPPTMAAPKSSAQRQREYRQRIAASRTPAPSTATRISDTERKRNYRLRKAYIDLASGSLESTTASSSRSAGRSNDVQNSTQRQLTNQLRQSLAAEPAQTTVQPVTSSDQIEVPDEPMDLTDLPLPSRSNAPVETQDAAASTSATQFAEPPTIAAPKSSAQRQLCEESNDLPYVMEDMTEDGKDLDTVCLGEKTRLDQSLNQNMCPMSVERNNLPYMMEERSKDEKDSEPVHLGGKTQGLNELCRSELDSKTNNTKQIRSFSCLQCSAKFNESSLLKIHSSIHTGEKPFSCSFCSAKFSRNDDFKVHVRTHTGEMPFSCSHCSSKFTAKKHLTAHLRKHTDVKPFSCSFCSTAFVQKAKLKRHLRTHTGEKPFSCSFCSTAFVQKANLKRHLRTHTGEKPFSCSFCSARFTVKNSLNYHISTHTGEKPFSCSFCSAKYYTKKTLGIHILSHIGEKQFSCSHCSAKFYVKSSLVTHIRSHTGEKPFSCSYCSSKFTQKCHLIAHLRIHTGEKPFSCSQCSAKFIENSSLRRHIRTHKCQ